MSRLLGDDKTTTPKKRRNS